MSNNRIIPVKDEEITVKGNMNYSDAAKILEGSKSGQIFLSKLSVKQASYAKKRLEFLCKCKLESHPAVYEATRDEGYVFKKIS